MRVRIACEEIRGLMIALEEGRGDREAELLREMERVREQARQEAMKGGRE